MNEQGRVTHYRNFWDAKDLPGLMVSKSGSRPVLANFCERVLNLTAIFNGCEREHNPAFSSRSGSIGLVCVWFAFEL